MSSGVRLCYIRISDHTASVISRSSPALRRHDLGELLGLYYLPPRHILVLVRRVNDVYHIILTLSTAYKTQSTVATGVMYSNTYRCEHLVAALRTTAFQLLDLPLTNYDVSNVARGHLQTYIHHQQTQYPYK